MTLLLYLIIAIVLYITYLLLWFFMSKSAIRKLEDMLNIYDDKTFLTGGLVICGLWIFFFPFICLIFICKLIEKTWNKLIDRLINFKEKVRK